ncbi:hypothetical protein AB0M50_51475 [Nonomuraea fuscirosea]|nr:hypothetical protein [Nonomuraea fuscirosea]WSA57224.1 hypothetical protein OIE67_22210 [Nonomuraea fuscirosea]
MRIALLQFVTLDGVTQGPGSPDQAAQAAYEGVTAFIDQGP